mmetsp:Transcript_20327/g.41220  ORF Transcript_20327/g.41220 Transcript_20327/m.41220 type:complete len:268 (-) Transcript_20327:199-1002(-)
MSLRVVAAVRPHLARTGISVAAVVAPDSLVATQRFEPINVHCGQTRLFVSNKLLAAPSKAEIEAASTPTPPSASSENPDKPSDATYNKTNESGASNILYEGPFAALSLRLKRVSITSAAVSLFGVPLLVALHGGDVPAAGQMAVGGSAILAATGSTVALSYCFSPYVHTLESISVAEEEGANVAPGELVKATTRNILAMKVETVFDPSKDITYPSNNRPFCNFAAKGVPMYVHAEMIHNEKLRTQLLGEVKEVQEKLKKNDDDDEFL